MVRRRPMYWLSQPATTPPLQNDQRCECGRFKPLVCLHTRWHPKRVPVRFNAEECSSARVRLTQFPMMVATVALWAEKFLDIWR